MGRSEFRVYRPVVPVLIGAVGEDVIRHPLPRISRTNRRASSNAAFTPPLIFRNRNALRGPFVQNPAERIAYSSSQISSSHHCFLFDSFDIFREIPDSTPKFHDRQNPSPLSAFQCHG